MSLARVSLVVIQALANQWACTPPNPTQQKRRYHTEEIYILQIAPLIFKIHMITTWICTLFEILLYLAELFFSSSGSAMSPSSSKLAVLTQMIVCPSGIPRQSLEPRVQRISPLFIIGVSAVVLGSYIRLTCFKLLGKLFTFDLTVHPEHRLITTSFYSYVRHPAYTGSMLLIAGLTFSHLTKGSWLTECGPLKSSTGALVVWMLWWTWTLACGISRAEAEDRQMQKMFPEEWDKYAENVAWWFFPGLI